MHNQQPWANRSDNPCLVTYNPISRIGEGKIVKRWWFQHIVHDVPHVAFLIHLFLFVQGRRRTRHCGAHTLINSQETCFVSALVTARQIGADYPFENAEARKWLNFYGRTMYGWRFRKASTRAGHTQTVIPRRPSDGDEFAADTDAALVHRHADDLFGFARALDGHQRQFHGRRGEDVPAKHKFRRFPIGPRRRPARFPKYHVHELPNRTGRVTDRNRGR